MEQWLHPCSATVKLSATLLPSPLPAMPFLFAQIAAAALLAQANPLMIPATNGTTCPGGTSYAGAGYCKVRSNAQFFPAKNGTTCPGGSSYAGAGYCTGAV
jgi:hypothetical protein